MVKPRKFDGDFKKDDLRFNKLLLIGRRNWSARLEIATQTFYRWKKLHTKNVAKLV
ncbi:hypothetical protein [Enterococcus faecium]|uniref:hypothetical protein n=1 Tax=Enterococcus faecium TaxID=1352 RepID=UPI003F7A46A7